MISGILTIGGVDISTYKAVLTSGYSNVMEYPQTKEFPMNIWHEYEEVEADLSDLCLASRNFNITVKFVEDWDNNDVDGFISLVTSATYLTYYFGEIGMYFTLRLAKLTNLTTIKGIASITLNLADDFPLGTSSSEYDYSLNGNSQATHHFTAMRRDLGIPTQPITINAKNLSWFGGYVLSGIDDLGVCSDVQENLLIDRKQTAGVVCTDNDVSQSYGDRRAKLRLWFTHSNWSYIKQNYWYLLNYMLTQKRLTIEYNYTDTFEQPHTGKIDAVYKNCDNVLVYSATYNKLCIDVTINLQILKRY